VSKVTRMASLIQMRVTRMQTTVTISLAAVTQLFTTV